MGKALVQDAGGKVLLVDKSVNESDLNALGITNFKDFREGLAPVQINEGNWGFLSTEGKLVIEATYLRVGYFSAGLAWAKPGEDQVGFIDKTNEMVIAPGYAAVKEFDPVSGMARVKNSAGIWLYIDKQGKELTIDANRFGDFSEGLCSIDKSSNPGVYGFIDKEGNWIIEPKYEATGDFHSGVCSVRVNKSWGLINKEGKVLIEPKYDGLEDFVIIK
jgi:plasmid maintenance system killer protein